MAATSYYNTTINNKMNSITYLLETMHRGRLVHCHHLTQLQNRDEKRKISRRVMMTMQTRTTSNKEILLLLLLLCNKLLQHNNQQQNEQHYVPVGNNALREIGALSPSHTIHSSLFLLLLCWLVFFCCCPLYTSDVADDLLCVDLCVPSIAE